MSTIASPRPSITLSSRRTSTSTDRSTSASRAPASSASSLRRNRTALRDYYNLKAAAPVDARSDTTDTPTLDAEHESELDKADFDPASYVQHLLANEGLEGVLRVEASLVGEIRSLDGEKKALVYDNYSKLIAATETIRSMREKMDPVTQTTSLMSDIGAIGDRAEALAGELRSAGDGDDAGRRRGQQQTVRWVLGAPERLRELVRDGRRQEAEAEWEEVSTLLEKWQAIKGSRDVRRACLEALEGADVG